MTGSAQFLSFYTDELLRLLTLDETAKDVFFAVAKHADFYGWCHPGDELLATLSHHRRDAVPEALERLQAAEVLHVVKTALAHRQEAFRELQVSPYVMRLRAEFHTEALDAWLSFKKQTAEGLEIVSTPITLGKSDRQPESRSRISSKNHLQEAAPETAAALSREHKPNASGVGQVPFDDGSDRFSAAARESRDGREEGLKKGEGQRAAPPGGTSQSDESTGVRRREPRDLRRYTLALVDDSAEQLALNLVSVAADLSLPNARMLVDVYPRSTIYFARQLFWEQPTDSVRSPARWLRKVIRRVDAQPESAGAAS